MPPLHADNFTLALQQLREHPPNTRAVVNIGKYAYVVAMCVEIYDGLVQSTFLVKCSRRSDTSQIVTQNTPSHNADTLLPEIPRSGSRRLAKFNTGTSAVKFL